MKVRNTTIGTIILGTTLALNLAACDGGAPGTSAAGDAPATVGATAAPGSAAPVSTDPNQITLALKYVSFVDDNGKAVITEDDAKANIPKINNVWKQCGIQFTLEDYIAVRPKDRELPMGLTSMDELDPIRKEFDEPNRLVVINTGAWSHGSMGPANAWTAMPGSTPSGAVFEAPVAEDGNIIAHELGHYLSLDHVNDQARLMNPIIYSTSTLLTPSECQAARDTANTVRAQAERH